MSTSIFQEGVRAAFFGDETSHGSAETGDSLGANGTVGIRADGFNPPPGTNPETHADVADLWVLTRQRPPRLTKSHISPWIESIKRGNFTYDDVANRFNEATMPDVVSSIIDGSLYEEICGSK
jgi:hypothetical protein